MSDRQSGRIARAAAHERRNENEGGPRSPLPFASPSGRNDPGRKETKSVKQDREEINDARADVLRLATLPPRGEGVGVRISEPFSTLVYNPPGAHIRGGIGPVERRFIH